MPLHAAAMAFAGFGHPREAERLRRTVADLRPNSDFVAEFSATHPADADAAGPRLTFEAVAAARRAAVEAVWASATLAATPRPV